MVWKESCLTLWFGSNSDIRTVHINIDKSDECIYRVKSNGISFCLHCTVLKQGWICNSCKIFFNHLLPSQEHFHKSTGIGLCRHRFLAGCHGATYITVTLAKWPRGERTGFFKGKHLQFFSLSPVFPLPIMQQRDVILSWRLFPQGRFSEAELLC